MRNRDILALCAGNLLRRKTRTILAVIGVIVGVCAIVVMVSIGVGLNVSFQEQIESFGNLHNITVYNWGGGSSDGKSYALDDSTIRKIEEIPGVTALTPVEETYLYFKVGDMVANASVYGVRPEYIEKMNYDVESGRSFMASDSDKKVVLFGYNIACWFYNPRVSSGYDWSNTEPTVNVVTKDIVISGDYSLGTNDYGNGEIKYEEFEAEGVGLLSGTDSEDAYRVYMPIDYLEEIIKSNEKAREEANGNGGGSVNTGGKKTYNQLLIYVQDMDKIQDICKSIKEDYGFYTYSLTDMLKEMQQTANMIEMVLGGIGAISLLVAAIGIANTMIMSVYERTREIGVMKVIGASLSDIQKMFLVEAGLIGFGGGVIGLIISFGISFLMNTFLGSLLSGLIGGSGGNTSVIPWWLALGALAFATLVGLLSGWLPAKRAMNLSALEGLKNE